MAELEADQNYKVVEDSSSFPTHQESAQLEVCSSSYGRYKLEQNLPQARRARAAHSGKSGFYPFFMETDLLLSSTTFGTSIIV